MSSIWRKFVNILIIIKVFHWFTFLATIFTLIGRAKSYFYDHVDLKLNGLGELLIIFELS